MAVSFQTGYFAHLYGSATTSETSSDTITIQTSQANATAQTIIVDLVFANSKSIRTSTIILAAFNVLAAFTTAFSIVYDSYWAQSRRCAVPNYKTKQPLRKFCVSQMHPAETFPLILNIGIGIQGLVFAGVQGTGLHSLFIDGCSTISQFMWPALFIVPYIEVVFGIECMRRACRHRPFQPRGKYDVTICLVIIGLMLIGTWIPSHIDPEPDHCFASLLWFISGFGESGFILLAVTFGLSIISAITICVRLSTFTLIDGHQRIAASRMVYYLILGSISMSFVMPYFILMTIGIASTTSSMIATVVLNLTGLMTGLLQLFLRSNTAKSAFKPKKTPNWSGDKHDIRLFGPNELGFGGHLLQPVSGPTAGLQRSESERSILNYEKAQKTSIDSIRSPPPTRSPQTSPTYYKPLGSNAYEGSINPPTYSNVDSKLPKIPEPTVAGSSAMSRNHQRQPSYSLYPTEGLSNPSKMQLPATTFKSQTSQSIQSQPQLPVPQSKFQSTSPLEPFFAQDIRNGGDESETEETFFGLSSSNSRPEAESVYSIGGLLPPPPLFRNNSRHKRNSSLQSTATVQIGLRISHAQPQPQPPSPDRLVQMPPPLSLPSTTYRAINTNQHLKSPPPFQPCPASEIKPNNVLAASVVTPLKSSHRPSPLTQVDNTAASSTRTNSLISLPSTPRPIRSPIVAPALERVAATEENISQLSPSVYSPQKSSASSIPRSHSRTGSSHATSPTRSNPLRRQGSQRTQKRYEESDDESSTSSVYPSRSATPTHEETGGKAKADWI